MRITNNLLIHNMLWNMNNNLVSMNEKQQNLSTGKRVHKPSDDPVGITKIIKVKSDIVENQQFKENVRDAKSWLDMSENSLMDVKEILQRARELAVKGANDTNTPEDADKIAKEIDQLIEEVIVNANSTMAGRYLFSGFNTDKKLLNEDGTFNVDITAEKMLAFEGIAYEVAVGENLEVGTNPLSVFGMVPLDNAVIDTFKFGTPTYQGVKAASATHTKIQGAFNYKTDFTSAGAKTVTVGGKTYTLDSTNLDGTQTQEEFIEALKNAPQTAPTSPPIPTPAPTLSGDAEIYFVEGSGGPELVIEADGYGPVTMAHTFATPADFPTTPANTPGALAPNAVLTGTANITDDLVSSNPKGQGTQSFVVTYNGQSERIDISMGSITTVSDMATAVNAKLDSVFGVGKVVMSDPGGPLPAPGAPVTFTAQSQQDGSRTDLKIDVIVSNKSKLVQDMQDFSDGLSSKDNDKIKKFLADVDVHLDKTIATLADIGAKDNRLTFIENRIDDNNLAMTEILSKVQDIDYSQVLIKFKSLESIYRASLSVGAKVIQPTLVDFIK